MSDQATTLRIKPLGDRILVKREEESSTARGGIILPDTAKKKQDRAEVLVLGSGKNTIAINIFLHYGVGYILFPN